MNSDRKTHIDDSIEVEWWVQGEYRGTKRIGRESIVGMFLSGNVTDVPSKLADMEDDINAIAPGSCTVHQDGG